MQISPPPQGEVPEGRRGTRCSSRQRFSCRETESPSGPAGHLPSVPSEARAGEEIEEATPPYPNVSAVMVLNQLSA